jgi:uncharacterized protein (TIGR03437 family)
MKQTLRAAAALVRFAAPLLFLSTVFTQVAGQSSSPFQPISSGYGANGTFQIREDKFPSPEFTSENVHVFRPVGVTEKVPVLFFAPGYSNTDPAEYRDLIRHVVSRGYALVFSPFQLVSLSLTPHEKRYDTIFTGFEEAVSRYGASFDMDRVGFVGHSYGAAASFAMCLRGIAKGWGNKGLLVYSMAPWYAFELDAKRLVNFPSHAKLVMQIFENDTICDHRMAKEIFEGINLPASEKDFLMLRSDERQGYKLEAEHSTPSNGQIDALDYYGIYRPLDALADYAFAGAEAGKRIALGNGSAEQRRMGQWPDGTAVREMIAGDCVAITRSSTSFLFPDTGRTPGLATVSAASQKTGPVAPALLVTGYGKELSASAQVADGGPKAELNGTSMRVKDGACREWAAPMFFVSPAQVNYLIPADAALGNGTVTVYNAAGAVSIGPLQINRVAPGVFSADATGQGIAAASVLRLRADGSLGYEKAVQFDAVQRKFVSVPIDLSAPNDQVFLLLFASGIRNRSALAGVSIEIGGVPVDVLYAGEQGTFSGLDQINLRLPNSLAGRGEVDVVMKVDGIAANVVRVRTK